MRFLWWTGRAEVGAVRVPGAQHTPGAGHGRPGRRYNGIIVAIRGKHVNYLRYVRHRTDNRRQAAYNVSINLIDASINASLENNNDNKHDKNDDG
ncbi:MAG: hypothetical protein V4754_04835 [Pseudomonadota bacterium]